MLLRISGQPSPKQQLMHACVWVLPLTLASHIRRVIDVDILILFDLIPRSGREWWPPMRKGGEREDPGLVLLPGSERALLGPWLALLLEEWRTAKMLKGLFSPLGFEWGSADRTSFCPRVSRNCLPVALARISYSRPMQSAGAVTAYQNGIALFGQMCLSIILITRFLPVNTSPSIGKWRPGEESLPRPSSA